MTMYYPTYHQQGDNNGIDVFALRQSILVCIGLISLLHLQQMHEGHMDGHVYQLFSDRLHAIEQQLAATLCVHGLENTPMP